MGSSACVASAKELRRDVIDSPRIAQSEPSFDGERVTFDHHEEFGKFCYSTIVVGNRRYFYCVAACGNPGCNVGSEERALLHDWVRLDTGGSANQHPHRLADCRQVVLVDVHAVLAS